MSIATRRIQNVMNGSFHISGSTIISQTGRSVEKCNWPKRRQRLHDELFRVARSQYIHLSTKQAEWCYGIYSAFRPTSYAAGQTFDVTNLTVNAVAFISGGSADKATIYYCWSSLVNLSALAKAQRYVPYPTRCRKSITYNK